MLGPDRFASVCVELSCDFILVDACVHQGFFVPQEFCGAVKANFDFRDGFEVERNDRVSAEEDDFCAG